ncbi:Hypothetical Protein FCC1311_099732 [Hondaea fermentalgiana]|uniref:Sulfhydryl oxidase n=1 Tax=Hondaea fermentalgiana TaxID=2315210 RepID=A0A2R5GSC7_9STRA|nr:Hypothetical Protein FCC1311_099732 [Hondaea fermentalgiana]|eukprot:GBG33750.1 Hypothetical Protein FCC1311_099732 [Hondaea fermentalgiana]
MGSGASSLPAGKELEEAFVALDEAGKAQVLQVIEKLGGDNDGTSLLELQTGLFRLIQGAAYRVHRGQFSANYHTHLTARELPYTWRNFVAFIDAIVELVLALDIHEIDASAWNELRKAVHEENTALDDRIANFDVASLSPEALAEHSRVNEENANHDETKLEFKVHVGAALLTNMEKDATSGKLCDLAHAAAVFEAREAQEERQQSLQQAHDERAKLARTEAGYAEGFAASMLPPSDMSAEAYLAKWNRVILEHHEERVDGSMIQVQWWYQDFMPRLLVACSNAESAQEQNDDSDWFEEHKHEFEPFACDVLEAWPSLGPSERKRVRRAWRLTRHYLNGFQKNRERFAESGVDHRATGDLSQYVAFLDVPLGRAYVRNADMRLTFPYFIGNAVWKFKHTVAEIACAKESEEIVKAFKAYMPLFATMYPCPYCRFHLNKYVALGRERDLYPIEYLLLGWNDPVDNIDGTLTLADKLIAIDTPSSLRLFIWKLHNAVNSSIYRQEAWYHAEQDAIYTSRYWPNIDADCHRAQQTHGLLSAQRTAAVVNVLKAATKLATVRGAFQALSTTLAATGEAAVDKSYLESLLRHTQALCADLDVAVVAGQFLQRAYTFDASIVDPEPKSLQDRGEFFRHEDFTLN